MATQSTSDYLPQRVKRLEVLCRIGNAVHGKRAPQKILGMVLAEAVRATRADGGSIMLMNPDTGLLDIEAARGLSKKARRFALRPGEGVSGWVAETGQPLLIADLAAHPRYGSAQFGIRSELAVPLDIEGQVMGVLNVGSVRVNA